MFENSLFYKDTYELSKRLGEKFQDLISLKNDKKNLLINFVDDLLIVWSKNESCLYCQTFQPQNDASENSKDSDPYKIQTLILSHPPIWEVNRIITNDTATGVLLFGEKGIGVVELPKRWGSPSLFGGGKDLLTCKVEYFGELLTCSSKIKIISAAWYPGSLNNSHIIMLSSDNYLRIYSILSPDHPKKIYLIGKSRQNSESKVGGDIALGETAVSFDIGSPTFCKNPLANTHKDKFIDMINEVDEIKQQHYNLEWPVFVLYNNGDVYYVVTSLNKKSNCNLHGPLKLLPNSFDNYGLDYLSLLVLQCQPMVIVILKSDGCMHHCILMENNSKEKDPIDVVDELSESLAGLNLVNPSYVLHVYESVHLNFSDEVKDCSPPILVSDLFGPTRYWLIHQNGISVVHVPFVEKLQSFEMSEKTLFPDCDLECQVENFLCTRSLSTSKPTSILGIAICYFPSKVFVMLDTGAIAVLPLPSVYVPHLQKSDASRFSTVQLQARKDFGVYVRDILKRSSSQPLVIFGHHQNIDLQDYLNLLRNCQDNLKKNYMLPQIQAKEEIHRRKKILFEQKSYLLKELNHIQNEKQALTNKAHSLAEKYEESNDKQINLMKRLERVLNQHVRNLPTLSCSERDMYNELESLVQSSQNLTSDLCKIRAKHNWHLSQKGKQEVNEAIQIKRSCNLSENQLACLKVSLSKESEKLTLLVKTVKKLTSELDI